jgi:hypothetical protein
MPVINPIIQKGKVALNTKVNVMNIFNVFNNVTNINIEIFPILPHIIMEAQI